MQATWQQSDLDRSQIRYAWCNPKSWEWHIEQSTCSQDLFSACYAILGPCVQLLAEMRAVSLQTCFLSESQQLLSLVASFRRRGWQLCHRWTEVVAAACKDVNAFHLKMQQHTTTRTCLDKLRIVIPFKAFNCNALYLSREKIAGLLSYELKVRGR